ncbi:hypothetical protein ASG14_12250 [Pedobacter sp. Leaf194]|nr:hypothetical protein ASG14_12250 [Pedobacter sp. Leaf194]
MHIISNFLITTFPQLLDNSFYFNFQLFLCAVMASLYQPSLPTCISNFRKIEREDSTTNSHGKIWLEVFLTHN